MIWLSVIFAYFFSLIFFLTPTKINWSVFWEAPFLRCLDLNLVHILFQPPDLQPLICLPDKAHSSLPSLMSLSSKRSLFFPQKEAVFPPFSKLPQHFFWIIGVFISIYIIPPLNHGHLFSKDNYYLVSIYWNQILCSDSPLFFFTFATHKVGDELHLLPSPLAQKTKHTCFANIKIEVQKNGVSCPRSH